MSEVIATSYVNTWEVLLRSAGNFRFDAGHVFAFGETRPMAIANMVLGLKELHIRGEIRTNVDYTVDILHVSAFPSSEKG